MATIAKSAAQTLLKKGDAASPEVFTTVADVLAIDWNGKKLDTVDVTSMSSTGNYREFIPTLFDGGELTFGLNYNPTNATHSGLKTDYDARTLRNWQLVLPSSLGTWSFAGYITEMSLNADLAKQLMQSCKIKVSGLPTFA